MRYNGRVFDNHFHLNYDGDFLRSTDIFIKAGGNAINLTNLPRKIDRNDYYKNLYENTIMMAERIRKERHIEVIVTIGPYPLDYFYFRDHGMDAEKIIRDAIVLAEKYIEDGKADALGEIGLPHFPVESPVLSIFYRLLEFAFSVDSDMKNPVILHTHDLSREDYSRIDELSRRYGLSGLIIKHHALALDLMMENDVWKSIPATKKNVREAISSKRKFMLETDFVDDPNNANRYLPADSVPKRKKMIEQEYDDADDILSTIFEEVPEKIYAGLRHG
ncbi:MAG: TatD family hydrolase [Thermoplasmata archaeon]